MAIPFHDLKRQFDELHEEINAAFARVLNRGDFVLGTEVAAFEREWAEFCGVRGAVGVGNGTEAITLALAASGVIEPHRGDEVITSGLSAAYTPLAIVNAGAVPVFVDIDEETFNLAPHRIEEAVTERTKAIVPVHLYGQAADMRAIGAIAARHRLAVIEDAAQAHGVRTGRSDAPHASLALTHSFYPTKNLGAFGDGGAVVSDDETFLARVRALRQGGHDEALRAGWTGLNSRLDEMQAAFLRVKLKRLAGWNARRRALAEIYRNNLARFARVTLPRAIDDHVHHLFVIRHPRRDELKDFLAGREIAAMIHYPCALHERTVFRSGAAKPLPVVEKIVGEILSLPLYPQIGEEEIESVCRAIAEFEEGSCGMRAKNAFSSDRRFD